MKTSDRFPRLLPRCLVTGLMAGLTLSLGLASQPQAQAGFKLPAPPRAAVPAASDGLLTAPPITTRFADAHNQIFLPDDFGKDFTYKPLTDLPRTDRGGFLLQPGFYELTVQSYSLQIGAYGPSGGQGYLSAALQGPQRVTIQTLLRRALSHPEIPQHEIQQLIWAILARAHVSTLAARLQDVAHTLLTPAQIEELNRTALAVLTPEALRTATAQLSGPVQQQLEAENQIRQLMPSGRFEALEQTALRTGEPPASGPEIPLGRWSDHDGGYFVRYFPVGYSVMRLQVYVPDRLQSARPEYDPSGEIAVSNNPQSQRLGLSARATDSRSAAVEGPRNSPAPVNRPKPESILESLPDRIPVIRVPATAGPRP
jgi:hypothetical protein